MQIKIAPPHGNLPPLSMVDEVVRVLIVTSESVVLKMSPTRNLDGRSWNKQQQRDTTENFIESSVDRDITMKSIVHDRKQQVKAKAVGEHARPKRNPIGNRHT